jgi:hypothetical protein
LKRGLVEGRQTRDRRRSRRSVARDPIVHGLSKREKKKKRAKRRDFVECLQSTTAPHGRLLARMPPSYPVACRPPPIPRKRIRRVCRRAQQARAAGMHVERRRSTHPLPACAQCGTFDVHSHSTAFDTMHSLTSAFARCRPLPDARPRACTHPSILPPPVAPPLVGAAPPPPALAG